MLFFKIKNERKQDIEKQKNKGTRIQRNAKNKAKNTNKGKNLGAKTHTMSTMMIGLTQVAAWSFVSY